MKSWRTALYMMPLLGLLAASGCSRDAGASAGIPDIGDPVLWGRMLEAEDSRGSGDEGLTPLVEGTRSTAVEIRRVAVRGLGRMEVDSLAPAIAPLLTDPAATVRAEAANAIAQAARNGNPDFARTVLMERLGSEQDASVLGVLAESLGRLPHADADQVAETALLLTDLVTDPPASAGTTEATVDIRSGVARGLFFLARQPAARGAMPPPTLDALRLLAVAGRMAYDDDVAARLRTVAAAALVSARALTADDLRAILEDPHPAVRREAIAGAGLLADTAVARDIAAGTMADSSASVRFEALRMSGVFRPQRQICNDVVTGVHDQDAHVALLAIDQLGSGCAGPAGLALLDSIASTLTAPGADATQWHRAAHAITSMARLDPARARPFLDNLEAAANPFARAWAARAALLTRSTATLRRLASDTDANVRSTAVDGLARVEGHTADPVYIAQLTQSDDSQLLQAAAAALEGSTDPRAGPALLAALERMSTRRRETERDARVALLGRIGELADSSKAGALGPRLSDYDPAIAEMAADLIENWTGDRPAVSISPIPRSPLPTLAQVDSLARATVTIEMADGGTITLQLLPHDAPTNAFRFARLAREGYFNGLTFHRVVPNFVLQGGSPHANEYAGDGPFSRDELGLVGNNSGTVGLSTRGRDTGDAQIYFNLIDNVRLDHDYTVFARVTDGFDVVLRQLEGAVIRRITVD